MAFLELDHVSVVFPAVQGLLSARKSAPVVAVDGVSLSVEKGEILGLVGESGCGKSTLSRTVMLLQKPTEGRIFLEGEELTALSASEVRKRRPDFQMVFPGPLCFPEPPFYGICNIKGGVAEPP
ncbi:ATP-binding cassette domain-containing protein [Akkermansia muciniphila]|uniref:ATP-binding cassette domain-containing protein n=1 Tax=Akkermansia muciniphila TaxID=239935 RepID=UPI00211EE00E|nr:ATP-binding cassette domain-containing protein [Akkermansia muciniphila]